MENALVSNAIAFEGAFNYEMHNGDVSVNLTQMAKSFGKEVKEWFKLPSTIDLVDKLKIQMGENPPFETRKGNGGGTWSYNDILTIEFARWLSVDFAIWCNQKIKDLLTQGFATRDSQSTEQRNLQNIYWLFNGHINLQDPNCYQLIALSCPSFPLPKNECDAFLTSKAFGEQYMGGMSAIKVNKLMEAEKLQFKDGRGEWQITENGRRFLSKKVTKGNDGQMHENVRINPDMAEVLAELLKN